MPSSAGLQPASAPMAGGASTAGEHRLIRYSHIFSAAVREVLELKLLDDIGAEELSLPQFHLLQLITLNGRHQMGEVADFLGVSPPAATKNIDKLERLGLVARTPCVGDRRATLLASSRKGRQLVRRFESLKRQRLAPLLAVFTNDELERLAELLERFATALIASDSGHERLCLRCSAHFDDDCPIQQLHSGCPYRKIVSRKHEGPVDTGAGETQPEAN